jgi:hypothetical protein
MKKKISELWEDFAKAFKRPYDVTLESPTMWQRVWIFLTMVGMGYVICAGFASESTTRSIARLTNMNMAETYAMLKGVTIGALIMTGWFAFGSNQVTVPLATVETHRPTAVLLGIGLAVVGIVLNWPAVVAFFNKFDLLYLLISIAGIVIVFVVIYGPKIFKRGTV